MHETIVLAQGAGDLPAVPWPDRVLAWAKLREITFPTELIALVERRWPSEPFTSPPAAAREGAPRERDNMLRFIIGMAIEGYKYDPKARRGTAIRDIVNDLEKLGIPVSDDAIRKYLERAAELLPPKSEPQ